MARASDTKTTTNPNREVYRVSFWIEANDYSYDVYLTQDEASVILTRLGRESELSDLAVWRPTAIYDGPAELLTAIREEISLEDKGD